MIKGDRTAPPKAIAKWETPPDRILKTRQT